MARGHSVSEHSRFGCVQGRVPAMARLSLPAWCQRGQFVLLLLGFMLGLSSHYVLQCDVAPIASSSKSNQQRASDMSITTLVILAYSESKVDNENLVFFLRQGVIANDPRFEFVIVVNGATSRVITNQLNAVAAAASNVHVRWRPNIGYDSCAWRRAFEATGENHLDPGGGEGSGPLNPPLRVRRRASNFSFVITINTSVRGPLLRVGSSTGDDPPWPYALTGLLGGPTDVRLAGLSLHCEGYPFHPPHVQSMLWTFLGSDVPWMMTHGFPCINTTDKDTIIRENELALPRAVVKAGHNLASLLTFWRGADLNRGGQVYCDLISANPMQPGAYLGERG
jgi:hypothetical protein